MRRTGLSIINTRTFFTRSDAPLVGLTATPKDEIDKNTYSIFELESGVPTYGYELAQAVKDGYLVDFQSVETTLKFIDHGIVYDELSEEDKEQYEDTFENEDGKIPEAIGASALNTWIFNEDTIQKRSSHINDGRDSCGLWGAAWKDYYFCKES